MGLPVLEALPGLVVLQNQLVQLVRPDRLDQSRQPLRQVLEDQWARLALPAPPGQWLR